MQNHGPKITMFLAALLVATGASVVVKYFWPWPCVETFTAIMS